MGNFEQELVQKLEATNQRLDALENNLVSRIQQLQDDVVNRVVQAVTPDTPQPDPAPAPTPAPQPDVPAV